MTFGILSADSQGEVERGQAYRSIVRIGLGIAVFLLSIPLIALSSDYAEVHVNQLTNCCFSSMLATGATFLPRPPKKKVVVIRAKD